MSVNQALKDQAIAYYQENKVPLRMQDVLNAMFRSKPPDVNGYVSTYFEELSHVPTITRALATPALDSKGQPAISTKVYCTIRNKEVLTGETRVSVDTMLMDNAKPEDKDAEDESRQQEVEKAITLINGDLQEIITSCNPRNQQELDTKIYELIKNRRIEYKLQQEEAQREAELATPQATADDGKKGGKKSAKGGSGKKKNAQMKMKILVQITPDRQKEKEYPGSTAVASLSQAIAMAGSSLSHLPLFDHLIGCYGGDNYSTTLPLPVMSIAQGGKPAIGKCNCIKEYMIVPRPDMSAQEAVSSAVKFHEAMVKAAFVKSGITAKNLSDYGTVCPTFDKPEQGLDMITDIVTQHEYEMGKDFFFMLNASAREFFDYEKGKYEVITGALKSSEDMADFWGDLINRYPAIIGIIDPVRGEEKDAWNKVCSNISDRCLVIGDDVYDRPGLLQDQELNFYEFATSGVVMRLGGCTTISQVVSCAKKMNDLDNVVMMATGQHDTNDSMMIDVAIASKARFVKLGAPNRGERIAKYNRLLEREGELGERKVEWKSLEFPVIPPKLPTPTPTPEPSAETKE